MKLVRAKQICFPPEQLVDCRMVSFSPIPSEDTSIQQVLCPRSPSPSPVSLTSSPVPPLPAGTCFLGSHLISRCQLLPGGSSHAGREVVAGAQDVGGEAGIRVSARREQAGARRLSELIPRAPSESRPSCPARFSPFLPHSFAWDYTVLGCLCFRVWDFKLVEPIRSR